MKTDLHFAGAEEALLDEGYERALELLETNLTAAGILACTPGRRAEERNYTRIFGRDAAICALGMIASDEPALVKGARASLRTLAAAQARNGQIPKFVHPETGKADFWYTGCIDATLWWLLALAFHDRHCPERPLQAELAVSVEQALQWLLCQEHPEWQLLQQNEASDWADIMPRSGFVLYTNALWHRVKQRFALAGVERTRQTANQLFAPFSSAVPGERRLRLLTHYIRRGGRRSDFYLSFVNFSFWGEEVDLFGNLLAVLGGLADTPRAGAIAAGIHRLGADRPFPLRVVGRPIETDSPLWRRYMQRHTQNLPFQYHNGGAWPFVGGFWVLMLHRLGRREEARNELASLAAANAVGGWQFNEWFHGRDGRPLGMPGQSWNAAMYLLAHRTVTSGEMAAF